MQKETPKIYWRKGEIAKELKVFPSTIGYWEKYFGQIHSSKTRTGIRLYNAQSRESLTEIHRLIKIEKYTLEGAKRRLNGRV